MARSNAKMNVIDIDDTEACSRDYRSTGYYYIYIIVINVFYSTTMVVYEHLPYPHIWMVIDLSFLSMKKIK